MFYGISLLMSIMMGQGIAFIMSWAIFAGTILAFPFENIEKGNMELLYATLPTNRKSMIFARYMTILLGLVLSLVLGIVTALILDVIFMQIPGRYVLTNIEGVYQYMYTHRFIRSMDMGASMYVSFMLTMVAIAVGAYGISTGIQTPFFYKFGYKKGRIFMWIPIIIITVVMSLPGLFGERFNVFNLMLESANNRMITTFVGIGLGIAAIVGSYFLSKKMYLKKDI